eukprot:m.236493 g.236493  ORF g.236493 m.236493 type:complete len:162 (+) comp20628_c0_seq1:47-532(+)
MAGRPASTDEDAGTSPAVEEFSLDGVIEHTAQYMGTISGLHRSANELVDQIDHAKRFGNVAWQTGPEDTVKILLSKYGIKVTDSRKHEVFARVPLHKIGSVLHYLEDSAEHIVVIETGDPASGEYKYYVYCMPSEADAKQLCAHMKQAFDVVYSKTVIDNL